MEFNEVFLTEARTPKDWISASSTSLVRNEHQLLALRFALGLAESGFYPGVLCFLTRWFPDAVSGRALALSSPQVLRLLRRLSRSGRTS